MLSTRIAAELAKHKITVNAYAPGMLPDTAFGKRAFRSWRTMRKIDYAVPARSVEDAIGSAGMPPVSKVQCSMQPMNPR